MNYDTQSPTNALQPGSGLGSEPDYRSMKFGNHPAIIQRRVDHELEEDHLVRDCKSDVMEWLKGTYPREEVTDLAGRLVAKEVVELTARYPLLRSSKKVRKQVVQNVLGRLVVVYPFLRKPAAPGQSDKVTSP